jgi:hypothetical protein
MFKANRLLAIIALVLFVVSMGSCGGGGGSSSGGSNGGTVIPSTTKVLDDSTMQNLSSISEDGATLTLSETTPTLESLSPGDVIVSGVSNTTPNGLLRKVTNVSKVGNQVLVQTTQATLEDAIQQGTVEVSQALTPRDGKGRVAPSKFILF